MKLPCATKVEPAPAEPSELEPIGTQPVATADAPPPHPTVATANSKKVTKERKKGGKKAQKKKTKEVSADEPVEPTGQ